RRAARIFSAKWCGVVVFSGGKSELHGVAPTANFGIEEAAVLAAANQAIRRKDASPTKTADHFHSTGLNLFVIPVRASNGESLGAICVYGAEPLTLEREIKLQHALANHAALSLENFQRFSQLERSKRQWVQDIDAITDYIVVHDRSWRIV